MHIPRIPGPLHVGLSLLLCTSFLSAADDNKENEPKDELVKRQHTATIAGKELKFTSTAGTLVLKKEDEKPKAEVFFVAYTLGDPEKVDETDHSKRPITFCFNGGPGSSSVWLHMGLGGPKRVRFADDASYPRPPYKLEDNPHSILDVTDLVFIDPVSTGYSRPTEGEKKSQFHGYDEDIQSVGEFIHLFLTRYERWSSPKFLMGESYGTMRAAGLSGHLHQRYNLNLNGILLVSAVLDFQTLRFHEDNDLPFILFLPTYTATAWYHKQLPEDLQKLDLETVVEQARKFVETEYQPAMFLGDDLPSEKREALARRIAYFTGVSADYVDRANLRINMSRFAKELLRDERLTVGRFDSRYRGVDSDAVGDTFEYDPSGSALFGAFTSALNQHMREGLGVRKDRPYEILTGKVWPWNYSKFENRYVSSTDTLREAMTKNPAMRVYIANGYYDLATPFYATEHTFRHLGLPEYLQDNIDMQYYEGGHMMYVHEPSMEAMRAHMLKFYADSIPK